MMNHTTNKVVERQNKIVLLLLGVDSGLAQLERQPKTKNHRDDMA
jgi:hypothetical protein